MTQLFTELTDFAILGNSLRHERGVRRIFVDSKEGFMTRPTLLMVRDCLRSRGVGVTTDEAKLIISKIFK